MLARNSLQQIFRKRLFLTVGIVMFCYTALVYMVYLWGLNDATTLALRDRADEVARDYLKNPELPLLNTYRMAAYVGYENIPEKFREMFPKEGLVDGEFHRRSVFPDDPSKRDFDFDSNIFATKNFENPEVLYFLVPYQMSNGERLYLLHWAYPGESKTNFVTVYAILGLFAVIAGVMLFWLASGLTKIVLVPLKELHDYALNLETRKSKIDDNILRKRGEVGNLARALSNSFQRIQNYHRREQEFLQNVSHELRTPITIVSTALDIVEQRAKRGITDIDGPINQIKHANVEMGELVESLLWLARDVNVKAPRTTVDIREMVESIVSNHKYLTKGKPLDIRIDGHAVIDIEAQLCRIVLSNLVRNAMEHAILSEINITIGKDYVAIEETGDNPNALNHRHGGSRPGKNVTGFGLGLHIVSRITKRQKWLFNMSTNAGNGNKVVLAFKDRDDQQGKLDA